MILNSKILDKILNSEYIKSIYPVIDRIETRVLWDGDEEIPFYDIDLNIYVNDPDMEINTMYEKGLDPHYLIDEHMIFLLKFYDISSRDINQIYIKVIGPEGNLIYG